MSETRWWRRRQKTAVSELQKRSNPVRTGIIFLVVLIVAVYFGFTKHIPFKHGYRLHAVFSSSVNVRPKSPVRIAGVTVGTVTSTSLESSHAALVTMEIEGKGLPIHSDATLKIRPKIFLEGNWFVELQPGSPSAPDLSSGATIPVTQTSEPVQLDQLLDALNTDTRANLQTFLVEYGAALTAKPTPAENAEQSPEVSGLNMAQALNKAYRLGPEALRDGTIINQAFAGTETHDLSKLFSSIEKVSAELDVHEQALGELVGHFNTFLHIFAAQGPSLRTAIAELPGALHGTEHAFAELQGAAPSIRTFALDLIPGVEQIPATDAAAFPWIEQIRATLKPNELGGVAAALRTAAPEIASVTAGQVAFQPQLTNFSKCLSKVLYPAGSTKLQDGANTSGATAEQGILVRDGGRGRPQPELQRQRRGSALHRGWRRHHAALPPGDRRKAGRSHDRQYADRPDAPGPRRHQPALHRQRAAVQAARALLHAEAARIQRPAVARASGRGWMMAPDEAREGGRGVRDQIERYRTAFIAVVTMIVIAAGSAGYILAHERLSVPAWVPILGHESFVLKGEFSTAQAVTPGQGQSVTIAGAKVGEISNVELRDGRALVSMNLTPKYAKYIYRDATALLRPKTGLKDETVEIAPGNPSSGRVSGGYTIPVTQTSPDGNLDEFLASFDTETRALLQALLAGVGEGLNGNSANLSATFKRFAPLGHELTEIGREVAKRQYYVEHGIHNFRLLMEALGSKDTRLAQSVEYGNAVFATFSREDRQVQETLHELPGVLKQANHGFGKLATATRVTGQHAARARALRHRSSRRRRRRCEPPSRRPRRSSRTKSGRSSARSCRCSNSWSPR